MSEAQTVRYAADIRPLFRVKDITSMTPHGLDLSSYEQVRDRGEEILERLEAGEMPCDGAWPEEKVDLFRRWVLDGKQP
jgi:hypothetical protein